MEIKKENCGHISLGRNNKNLVKKCILPGEIKGLKTFYLKITDSGYNHKKKNKFQSIFLLFNGAGSIKNNSNTFRTNEIAVFVPSDIGEASFYAENGILEVLEIELKINEDDFLILKESQEKLPYFATYTNCTQYKESIKSAKTISRMILPENIIPRFCMGSAETSGPDRIGEHEHPMLEQLFFGLANNQCIVKADIKETLFNEYELLHIPLGSVHGVEVKDGNTLHYIWIDYFKSQNEMKYISENHIMNEEN